MKLDKNLLSNKNYYYWRSYLINISEKQIDFPEAPVPILKVKEENYSVGGAANVASNLANLGINASIFSLWGRPEFKIL